MNNTSVFTPSFSKVDKKVITWCVTYATVAVAIILNNAAAIAAFRKSRLLRKLGNLFLVNLAVADLMVGTIALPMYIHLIYNTSFVTDYDSENAELKSFQALHIAFDVFAGMASVFTLTVISMERVYAIYFPLRYRSIPRTAYCIILVGVWLFAGSLSAMVMLTIAEVIHRSFFAYSLAILSFTSLVLMVTAYASLWLKVKLWTRHQDRDLGQKERNLATAIAIVTVVFLLTWAPFHIMNILINFKASLFDGFPYQVIYFAKFLHYSNSFVNPVIYCFKISEFRRALKSLLTKRPKKRETKL